MLKILRSWSVYYWLFLFSLFVIVSGAYDGLWVGGMALNAIRIPIMAFAARIIFESIFPSDKFHLSIKIIQSLLLLIVLSLINRYLFGILIFPNFFQGEYSFQYLNFYRIISNYIIFLSGIAGYGLIKYYSRSKEREIANRQLLEQKKSAELSFYKAQLHPHFLFNTLNSVYNETLKKSDKAPELILKISDMLRFILYECDQKLIPVEKELKLIRDFVDLEKSRYGAKLDWKLYLGNEIDKSERIPPLLIFALVENAFKHGVSPEPGKSFVRCTIEKAEDRKLNISIKNTARTNSEDGDHQKGIGLKNVISQLQLLFEDRFTFNASKRDDIFKVEMNIPYE